MNKILIFPALFLMSSSPCFATFSTAHGAVTPSGIKVTITSVKLTNSQTKKVISIFDGSYDVEFTRAGSAFAEIPITTITVPVGVYDSVTLSFNSAYQVKLNGDTYFGNGGSLSTNTAIYTTSAVDGRGNGAVTSTAGTATYVSNVTATGVNSGGKITGTTTKFAIPACVAVDKTKCTGGSRWVGGDGVTLPNINILLDLYQAIVVDGSNLSLAQSNYTLPFAMLGAPGAAVHISGVNGGPPTTGNSNITMIFAPDKSFLYAATMSAGTTSVGPTGGSTAFVNPSGTSGTESAIFVGDFDTSSGQVRFVTGSCTGNGGCFSNGLVTLNNILQSVGSSVTYTCTSDTTGALGVAYTGGTCTHSAGNGNMKIARIIDPGNIFGTCATGTCAATSGQISGTNSDGYL